MTYKSILVHVDDSPNAPARYAAAAQLALGFHANLTGLVSTGLDRFIADAVVADSTSPAITPYLDTLRERANRALDKFGTVAAETGLKDVTSRQTDAEPYACLAAMAAYGDLCIATHYGQEARPDRQKRQVAADLAAGSGCPILLLPDGFIPAFPFGRVLVAWNGGAEASRALHFALPLLQRATQVDIAILDDALEGGAGWSPAAEIGRALLRHGIDATVLQRRNVSDVGHALLELAREQKSDLLVMGCYGHSRVREMLLGGATRSVLVSITLPVFMAA